MPDEPKTRTPIKYVTVANLLESYQTIERLLRQTRDRITEVLAEQHGVKVGSRVDIPGSPNIEITGMHCDLDFPADAPAAATLFVHGFAIGEPASYHSLRWVEGSEVLALGQTAAPSE